MMKHRIKRYSWSFTFALALYLALVGAVLHPITAFGQAARGGSGANNPVYAPSRIYQSADHSPDETTEMLYDSTVTGISNGAFAWYDGSAVRYLVDLDTLPSNDDYVIAYDADADKYYMKADATGSAAFTDLTDTPGSYTTGNAIYTTNATPDAVIETTVVLTEDTNTFAITKGTASLDVAAGATVNVDQSLTVNTEAVTLDQSLSTTDDVTFADITASGVIATTPSSDQSISADTTVTVSNNIIRLVGNAGAVTSTATPFLAAATDGTCVKLQGTDDTNTVTIQDETDQAGSTLELAHNQSFTFGIGDMMEVCYDSGDSKWYELSRSDN